MAGKRKGKYRRLSQEDFISRCKENQICDLDYSEVVYKTQHERVLVKCNKHDLLLTPRAQALMIGKIVCPLCLKEQRSKITTSNKEVFVEKFRNKFPERLYDFSKAVYTKSCEHIDVVCDRGHHFTAKPNNLMSGHGCPICHQEIKRTSLVGGKDYYLPKFASIFGETYDYSKTDWSVNCKQKVIVSCKVHGDFKITKDNHATGRGCPACKKTGFNPLTEGFFYVVKVTDNVIKFGITSNLTERIKQLQNKCCFNLELLFDIYSDGHLVQNLERLIILDGSIKRGVISRCDMKSGFTETTYISNLSSIQEHINNFFTNNTS